MNTNELERAAAMLKEAEGIVARELANAIASSTPLVRAERRKYLIDLMDAIDSATSAARNLIDPERGLLREERNELDELAGRHVVPA